MIRVRGQVLGLGTSAELSIANVQILYTKIHFWLIAKLGAYPQTADDETHRARRSLPINHQEIQDMPSTLDHSPSAARRTRTPLNRTQIVGFWGAWAGWTLDGMDSFIYALVLAPALAELLPKSGYAATPANIGLAGSILFALFLVGWGLSFIWGPLADRFGRTKVLAGTIFMFAIFPGLAGTSTNRWEL